jgi:hypothetical protein
MSVGFLADYETANSAIKTLLHDENPNRANKSGHP